MAYLPVKTITIAHHGLRESHDLTVPLGNFLGSNSYLALAKDSFTVTVSLGAILREVVDLDLTKPVGQALTGLLTDLFVAQFGVDYVPVTNSKAYYNNNLVVFSPIGYKDHQVHFTSVNTPDIRDDPKKRGYLDDLAIVSDHDMQNYLVAVNGVFHRTRLLNGVLYVLDGFRTIRLSRRHDVTVVDTSRLGGHTIIPLTTGNVTKAAYNGDFVVTTTPSLQDKTVFAVIDGYFYHRDAAVFRYGDTNHLKIATAKLPLVQQFRHNPRTVYYPDRYGETATQQSRQYRDDYAVMFNGKSSLAMTAFATADFQYSRLTAFHSFLVVVNNAHVYTAMVDASPTGTPRFYRDDSHRVVSGMAQYGCGLTPSYVIWKDSFDRKSIFLQKQDNDMDYQDHTALPTFIGALTDEADKSVNLPLRFVDYIVA